MASDAGGLVFGYGCEHDCGAVVDDGVLWLVAGAAIQDCVEGAAGADGGGGGAADGGESVLLCVQPDRGAGAGDGVLDDAGAVAGGRDEG